MLIFTLFATMCTVKRIVAAIKCIALELHKRISVGLADQPFMLNCKINGTVQFFLHISVPGDQNSPIFSPVEVYPLFLHVIIDFGQIGKKQQLCIFSLKIGKFPI